MISTVFFGTPAASVAALEATRRVSEIRLVVTQPDRARGRSRSPVPPPIKVAAEGLGLAIVQPVNRHDLLEALSGVAPFDVGIIVAFGRLLRSDVLAIPRRGFVNIHFSLLPRWRGAAPVERAILAGDRESGATLMAVDLGLDTGPTISSRRTSIADDETSGQLLERLSVLGAELLEDDLRRYADGFLVPAPQPPTGITYAEKVEAIEAHLPLDDSGEALLRRIRGFNPRPGAFALLDDRRFKIWRANRSRAEGLEVGELRVVGDALCLGVGDGSLEMTEVQPEGSRRMAGIDWARGRHGPPGRLS